MAIEGVHLVPGHGAAEIDGALLVHAVLQRRERRGAPQAASSSATRATGGVRARSEKYLDQLDEIRRLQDAIVERAERTACR